MSSKARLQRVQKIRNETNREMSANKRAAGLTFQSGWAVDRDAERFRETAPPDTRTPAQRLMGEPMFERSALYRRTQEDGRS